jgi:ABC-type Mn2+/Zn2+ transport system ATPase subunit
MVQRRLGSSRAAVEWGDMLELQGLTRRYGDLVALDDLSFTVAEGQLFGFVGPNGAGKTTAMRIVLGVLEPDAGQVFWRGSPIDERTRRRTGYMPEDHGHTFSRRFARIRDTAAHPRPPWQAGPAPPPSSQTNPSVVQVQASINA